MPYTPGFTTGETSAEWWSKMRQDVPLVIYCDGKPMRMMTTVEERPRLVTFQSCFDFQQ